MIRVGLTGGIACGKSQAAQLFRDAGVPVLDADELTRDLTRPGQPLLEKVVQRAGSEVLLADGNLNRPLLRKQLFQDDHLRQDIEALLHPPVLEAIRDWFTQQSTAYAIAVVPLLIEVGWQSEVDCILVIDCPVDLQRQRLLQRPAMDAAQAEAILKAQLSSAERLQHAHDIIDNSGSPEDLAGAVQQLHQQYLAHE